MKINPTDIAEKITKGNRRSLAKAITLVESSRRQDLLLAQEVLKQVMPSTGNSLRIGITGVPGVGKSTFIEAFGNYLVDEGHKVAVLAVDPSSPYTGGSILGDKTRMQELSRKVEVFIRPSPTGGTLGGVSRKTRESILLCEAAGYDVILIETVGVGQSEYEVSTMVDFFLMLMLPAGGDSLQGIKRGIMEIADLILVNKADGDLLQKAKVAQNDLKTALHFLKPKFDSLTTDVLLCSALTGNGVPEVWTHINEYTNHLKSKGLFNTIRNEQFVQWTRRMTEQLLVSDFWESERIDEEWKQATGRIRENKTTPLNECLNLLERYRK